MKLVKKLTAVCLTVALTSALFAIPASATVREINDKHGATYRAPAVTKSHPNDSTAKFEFKFYASGQHIGGVSRVTAVGLWYKLDDAFWKYSAGVTGSNAASYSWGRAWTTQGDTRGEAARGNWHAVPKDAVGNALTQYGNGDWNYTSYCYFF
ncbi:MAG: hypothetical protein LBQ91_00540 [Oscillospiraceae bacterium]|jgi:hypothetical protein|nr:hypothetical protein [Oscillospiraceae bacterium]